MVRAYHVIFCAYGFWLPNDPRGSWSDWVGSWELLRFGPATKTISRRSVAAASHDTDARRAAKRALKYRPVVFDGAAARAVGRGFGAYVERASVRVLACSILPDHVHMVIDRHRLDIEQVVNQLKGAATRRLIEEDRHPLGEYEKRSGRPPSPWARGLWKGFLDDDQDIERSVRYVQSNPIKEGKQRQRWGFVEGS